MGAGAGAGAGTRGYTDKKAALGSVPSADDWLDKDGVKALFGESFNDAVDAAFEKAKNEDGKVHKAQLFVEACLIKVASNDDGLLPQPKTPLKQTCVVQIYVNSHEFGGTDKSCNGHRYDTMPFCNGMINAGIACFPLHYVHSQHDTFVGVMEHMDAILVRCNPGQIKADGGDQQKFDDAMRALQKKGKPVWPSPDVMEFMGAKDALTKIKDLNIGMPDTGTYYTEEEFIAGFKKSMKFQPRVIKQNRGSSGEGIWIINLKKGDYCAAFGDATAEESDELILMEANDNHVEEHTVGEFIAWCIHGRDEGKGAGEWKSKGTGKYLEGGKAAGGQVTDQRFACRILEGELRINMVNTVCLGIIHKVPAPGGMSAVGGTGSDYFYYDNAIISDQKVGQAEYTAYVQKEKSSDGNLHRCAVDEGPKKVEEGTHEKKTIGIDLAALLKKFTEEDCPVMMKTLDLADEPIPLWWTADMINASLGECWTNVPVADQKWVVGEFNCSCVGVSKCLPAYCTPDTPNVSWKDIPKLEAGHATKYGDIVGREAAVMLGVGKKEVHKAQLAVETRLIRIASNDDGLLPQPKTPLKQTCVVQIYVSSQEFGGSDKSCNGHRYDTMPFCNGMINAGIACFPLHYVHSQHDTFVGVMEHMDAILVRCNPGQIKADGGDQQKFDDAMRALQKKGKPVWPSPDVMEFMGAKDALTKIKDLNIGMPDTGTYYTEEEFIAGFKKSMKFQPRVIKQNRGSSGEGIWIINLKKGDYCAAFGDATVEESDALILMEANDNHVEEHTVAEFIAWCIHGRDEGKGAGEWKSKGTGKYLEGGKAAGGQVTDQRFACRILEGELRINMVNTVCLGIIHKVPAPGGMSAVGGTGSDYFYYDNAIISDQKVGQAEYTAYVQKEKSSDGNLHRCAVDEGPKKVEEGTHEKKTIGIDLAALLKKFTEEDCPVMMKTLDLADEPIPLWWTADMINASLGECWTNVPVADQKWVVGEFNCSCVGISKCLPAYCKPDTPNVSWKDIPAEEAGHATKYGDIVGREAAGMLGVGTK